MFKTWSCSVASTVEIFICVRIHTEVETGHIAICQRMLSLISSSRGSIKYAYLKTLSCILPTSPFNSSQNSRDSMSRPLLSSQKSCTHLRIKIALLFVHASLSDSENTTRTITEVVAGNLYLKQRCLSTILRPLKILWSLTILIPSSLLQVQESSRRSQKLRPLSTQTFLYRFQLDISIYLKRLPKSCYAERMRAEECIAISQMTSSKLGSQVRHL